MDKALLYLVSLIGILMLSENSNDLKGQTYSSSFYSNFWTEKVNAADSVLLERLQGKWKVLDNENDEVWIEGKLWTINGFLDHSTYNPYYEITIQHGLDNCGKGKKEVASILLIHQSEPGQPIISYELIAVTDSTLDLKLCPDNLLRKFKRKR